MCRTFSRRSHVLGDKGSRCTMDIGRAQENSALHGFYKGQNYDEGLLMKFSFWLCIQQYVCSVLRVNVYTSVETMELV